MEDNTPDTSYSAKDITVLEGLEPVRSLFGIERTIEAKTKNLRHIVNELRGVEQLLCRIGRQESRRRELAQRLDRILVQHLEIGRAHV